MRYRATLQAQRSRRNLNQQALQRSHRRCDLIRLAPEGDAEAALEAVTHGAERREPAMVVLPSPS